MNFKKVFAGTSSDSTSGDIFKLDKPTEAKFFKFIGQGGSNTDWILLHELEFIE